MSGCRRPVCLRWRLLICDIILGKRLCEVYEVIRGIWDYLRVLGNSRYMRFNDVFYVIWCIRGDVRVLGYLRYMRLCEGIRLYEVYMRCGYMRVWGYERCDIRLEARSAEFVVNLGIRFNDVYVVIWGIWGYVRLQGIWGKRFQEVYEVI